MSMLENLKAMARRIRPAPRPRFLRNVYTASGPRRALLAHLTYPFRTANRFYHIQYDEARMLAAVLGELGYTVDVVDYDYPRALDYPAYDLMVGMGPQIRQAFQNRRDRRPAVWLYSPGIHNHTQNLRVLHQVRAFHERHGRWLLESGRFAADDWTSLAVLTDAVIALGNEAVRQTYREQTDRPVYTAPGFYYQTQPVERLLAARRWDAAPTHALWFGSRGLIHKGLDLALEAVARQPGIILHVCGPLHRERSFMEVYRDRADLQDRVVWHGFTDIRSAAFAEILQTCSFLISPSCCEGGASAVLTALGNGGLIPVASRETGLDLDDYGLAIETLTVDGVARALQESLALDTAERARRGAAVVRAMQKHHTPDAYRARLRDILRLTLSSGSP